MCEAAPVLPGVVIVGCSGADAAHALAESVAGAPRAPGHAGPLPLRLDTRYYTAAALVHVRAPDEAPPAALEAAVLALDTRSAGGLAAARAWWAAHGGDHLAVRVVAASGCGAASGAAALREAAAWCAEALVELVELDGAGAAEGGGPARLAEALAAHVWPGLEMKPRGGAGGAGGSGSGVPPAEPDALAAAERAVLAPAEEPAAGAGAGAGGPDSGDEELDRVFASVAALGARLGGLDGAARRDVAAGELLRLLDAMGVGSDDDDVSSEEGGAAVAARAAAA
jgi:hypothetical protein